MKTKILATVIFIQLLILSLAAQTTSDCPYVSGFTERYAVKERNPQNSGPTFRHMLNYGPSGMIAIYTSNDAPLVTFLHLSPDFKLLKTYPIQQSNEEEKKCAILSFKKKRYCLIENRTSSSKDNKSYNVLNFSNIQFDFKGPLEKTLVIPSSIKLRSKSDCFMSLDSTKVLYTYDVKKADGKDESDPMVGMYVMDENLGLLYKNEYQLNGFRKRPNDVKDNFLRVNTALSNDGKTYFLYESFYDDSQDVFKDGKTNFCFKVVVFEKDKVTPTEYKIDLGNYFVDYFTKPKWIQNKDNTMSIAFMCKKDGKYKKMQGFTGEGNSALCYINLNANKEIRLVDNLIEIPTEITDQYTSKINPGSGPKISGYFELNNAISMPDGSVKVIIQELNNLRIVGNGYSKDEINSNIFDEKGGIYVININSNNKYEWITKIPNRGRRLVEAKVAGGFIPASKLHYMVNGDNLDLFYWGNKKNMNLPFNQFPEENTQNKDIFVLVSRIDKQGKAKTFALENANVTNTYVLDNLQKNGSSLFESFDPDYLGPLKKSESYFQVFYYILSK